MNIGGSSAYNFTVEFWDNHPNASGTQINGILTVTELPDVSQENSNTTLNVTWTVSAGGPHYIYVFLDFLNNITEINETNNYAYALVDISGWQTYYGNMSALVVLDSSNNMSQITWNSLLPSNIYFVESGTAIDWDNLQALGRNTSGLEAGNDFYELDYAIGMVNFTDSINNSYTYDFLPRKLASFTVYDNIIANVPIRNSTDTESFITGILWDASDGGPEYDGSQDIVFFTNSTQAMPGKYGIYDYEISMPALLREYKLGAGSVTLYVEIK
ncbi:MAG: hypothetical protein KKF44_04835 [Nanoarchaeota archaeon]|nr:hypothetical protein [Nanoarchaeota archaeon]